MVTSLIVLAAGQPDPAAPGMGSGLPGWGTTILIAVFVGVFLLIARSGEKKQK